MTTPDRTLPSELDGLARFLEDRAGVTPPASLRRDVQAPAAVHRIRDAMTAILVNQGIAGDARTIAFSVQDPENTKTFAGRGTKSFGAWANTSGRPFRIERVLAVSDADNYSFLLLKSASLTDLGTTNDVLMTTVTCSADGTAAFTADSSSLTVDTIEDGKWLIWEHSSGTAESVTVMIQGSYV